MCYHIAKLKKEYGWQYEEHERLAVYWDVLKLPKA